MDVKKRRKNGVVIKFGAIKNWRKLHQGFHFFRPIFFHRKIQIRKRFFVTVRSARFLHFPGKSFF
jgi:hypothetical protein